MGRGGGKRLECPPPHDASNTLAPLCPAVKHSPAEPSRFVSVLPKMPDKMGFDEVGWAFWGGREGGGTQGWRFTEAPCPRSS